MYCGGIDSDCGSKRAHSTLKSVNSIKATDAVAGLARVPTLRLIYAGCRLHAETVFPVDGELSGVSIFLPERKLLGEKAGVRSVRGSAAAADLTFRFTNRTVLLHYQFVRSILAG